MRVVVIGATGHIGGYLIPRLVTAGHAVVAISRGSRAPYRSHPAWESVETIHVDREHEEARGAFGRRIAELGADAVVDLICFTPDSAEQLVAALRPTETHLVHCGTIWVHGPATTTPITEEAPRRPFGDYGVKKAAIERLLIGETHRGGLAATVLHPGHIVGPGWLPVNPAGNLDPTVFARLACGLPVALPNFGLETVHHVHADDVAQTFALAIEHRDGAAGEAFHVVSERALTLRGYAEEVASWFGRAPILHYLPYEEWRTTVSAEDAELTYDHIAHSPSIAIEKARRILGFAPAYTSLEAVQESLVWLIANSVVDTQGAMPTSTPART